MNNSIEQLENGTIMDKIIVLKSIYKTGSTLVQPRPDGMGWYMGVPRLSEADKSKVSFWAEPSSKFKLEEGVTFDLNNESHKVTWAWVKHLECIAEDFDSCQQTKDAMFYVHQENKEAQSKISRRQLRNKAENYILNDSAANYPQRAELLGVNMDSESPLIIQEFLLDRVDEDVDRIIAIYESHDISLRILLIKAKKKHIITVDESGIHRYGNTVLGTTESSCIAWMQDAGNKHLFEVLEKEVSPDYIKRKEDQLDILAKARAAKAKKKAEREGAGSDE